MTEDEEEQEPDSGEEETQVQKRKHSILQSKFFFSGVRLALRRIAKPAYTYPVMGTGRTVCVTGPDESSGALGRTLAALTII